MRPKKRGWLARLPSVGSTVIVTLSTWHSLESPGKRISTKNNIGQIGL